MEAQSFVSAHQKFLIESEFRLVKSEKKIPDGMLQAQLDYWIEGSIDDMSTANAIFEKTDRYGASLFFLHLCLEKQLKALFVKKFGVYAPLSHNLLSLAERCDLPLNVEQEIWFAEINEFNMMTRYPMEKTDFYRQASREFADLHLNHGKVLQQWISEHLKK